MKPRVPSSAEINYIKSNFTYDEVSGMINRTDRKNSSGSLDKNGYLILKVKGRQYKAHRIAWLLGTGVYPINVIDHLDGDVANNRLNNLRDVSVLVNNHNIIHKVNKDTGVVGIHFDTSTDGLLALYTTIFNNKTYRFRELKDAINFRIEKNLPVKAGRIEVKNGK